MLVIRRRAGESFWIGEQVEIEILQIGSQVKVGIRAPKGIAVLRTEVKLIQEANLESAQQPTDQSLQSILDSFSEKTTTDR